MKDEDTILEQNAGPLGRSPAEARDAARPMTVIPATGSLPGHSPIPRGPVPGIPAVPPPIESNMVRLYEDQPRRGHDTAAGATGTQARQLGTDTAAIGAGAGGSFTAAHVMGGGLHEPRSPQNPNVGAPGEITVTSTKTGEQQQLEAYIAEEKREREEREAAAAAEAERLAREAAEAAAEEQRKADAEAEEARQRAAQAEAERAEREDREKREAEEKAKAEAEEKAKAEAAEREERERLEAEEQAKREAEEREAAEAAEREKAEAAEHAGAKGKKQK